MSCSIRAYRVELQLFERDDPESDWNESDSEPVAFITVAKSLAHACDFVATTWMEKDDTERTEFEWRAVGGQQLEGECLLP